MKKNKRFAQKLSISKETIARLNPDSQDNVKGGATFGCTYPCICDQTSPTYEDTCQTCFGPITCVIC